MFIFCDASSSSPFSVRRRFFFFCSLSLGSTILMLNGHSARLSSGSALGLLRADAMVAKCCDRLRLDGDGSPVASEMRRFPGSMARAECKTNQRVVGAPKISSWVCEDGGGMKATVGNASAREESMGGWPQARRGHVARVAVRACVRWSLRWLGKTADDREGSRELYSTQTGARPVFMAPKKEWKAMTAFKQLPPSRCYPGERCSCVNGQWQFAA